MARNFEVQPNLVVFNYSEFSPSVRFHHRGQQLTSFHPFSTIPNLALRLGAFMLWSIFQVLKSFQLFRI